MASIVSLPQPSPRLHESTYKLLIIGDQGVGKSSLLLRYCEDAFAISYINTIGLDYKSKRIELEGETPNLIKLQIWDTAGQERFRTLTLAYYRGAMGILLVYDVTNELSFQHIRRWMSDVTNHAPARVQCMLVGNKKDLRVKRVVKKERGKALADEYGIPFFETSAKFNSHVSDIFIDLAIAIKAARANNQSAASSSANEANSQNGMNMSSAAVEGIVQLKKDEQTDESSCCCSKASDL